jgi:SUKH-4 immunity protein
MKMTRPHYSLVHITVEVGDSRNSDCPAEIAVPHTLVGREYQAMQTAELLKGDGMGSLLAFGVCALDGRMCLDVRSGAVVHVPTVSQSDVNPANSSLDKFLRCVEAVVSRFPFYGIDVDGDETDRIAAELSEELAEIDPETQAFNGFWETFLDDLAMGNYATESVLAWDE